MLTTVTVKTMVKKISKKKQNLYHNILKINLSLKLV